MKLQHTLGGLEGLGPVDFEKRVFVEDWEKRIFGIHTALMGLSDSLRGALPGYELDSVDSVVPHDVDLGRPAQGRRGDEPVRLLQVPLLREVARRHQFVLHRAGLPDRG